MRQLSFTILVMLSVLAMLAMLTGSCPAQSPAPASPAGGAPKETPKIDEKISNALRSGSIMLNFDSIDIKVMTKIMAELTKRTIIVDKSVSGNITILSSRKVPVKEAWNLYISAVEAAGYGVVQVGKAYKVIPIADARKEDTRYVGMRVPKLRTGYVVALVLMNNADSELMANTLRPMMGSTGIISSYQPSNAVVITDSSQNVTRLTQIIRHLDANYRGSMLRVYQPKYIRVKELATSLQAIFQGVQGAASPAGGVNQQVRISAYEPTNTLLIMATDRDFLQIENILSDIDAEDRVIKPDVRTFRVHYLKNADAEEVAKTIGTMMEEKKRLVEEIKKEQQGTAESKEKETFISSKLSFDKTTNSLVFYLTDKEYSEIKPMIDSLDIEHKQVLITCIIAEVYLKKMLDIGSKWHVVTDGGLASFGGGLSLEGIYNTLAAGGFIAGGVSSEGVTLEIGGKEVFYPKIFALINALQTDNALNLLSAPRVLTHDHKLSKFIAGTEQPFATGVKYDNNNQPVISYEYKQVGLDLEVTPHIGQNDQVRIDMKLTIKDLVEYLKPNVGVMSYVVPVISNREIKNFITLANGQTIIIGGLIDNKTLSTIKSVPLLEKIPLLGDLLFKDKSKTAEKRTLFVFLTPHIINNSRELQEITDMYGRIIHEDKAKNEKAPFIIDESKEETH
ncbi:MAG: type II secretion system secretin GspD [Candidatus Eremiobacteraeota bacterium]|nr:type II secretion system secretin GspD [Candidatus Eremiobacteraeota bacterium]